MLPQFALIDRQAFQVDANAGMQRCYVDQLRLRRHPVLSTHHQPWRACYRWQLFKIALALPACRRFATSGADDGPCPARIDGLERFSSTLKHLLRSIDDFLHLPLSTLNNLLHRLPSFHQIVRPRTLTQSHSSELLLLLPSCIPHARTCLLARLCRFIHGRLTRVRCRRRDVEDEEQRIGACRIRLRGEG